MDQSKIPSLENAGSRAAIQGLLDGEFVSRGRISPEVIEKIQIIKERLFDHLTSKPCEHLEKGILLIGNNTPLSQLHKEVIEHFPEIDLSDITC